MYALIIACYGAILIGYIIALYTILKHCGPTFGSGVLLGIMYLVFPPLWVLLLTGELRLLKPFHSTGLGDVYLNQLGPELFGLLLYLMVMLTAAVLGSVPFKRIRSGLWTDARCICRKHDWLMYLVFYLAVVISFGLLSGAFSGGHWYSSRDAFLESSSLGAIFPFLTWAFRILILSSCLSQVISGRWHWTKSAIIIFFVTCVELLLVGNRIFILVTAATVLMVLVSRQKLCYVAMLGLLAVPIGYLMAVYQEIRSYLFLRDLSILYSAFLIQMSTFIRTLEDYLLSVTESVDLTVLLTVLSRTGESLNLLWGSTLFKAFVFWIPRSVWSDKPIPISEYAGHVFAPGVLVSLNPLIIGEFHWNFGYLGLIALPMFLFAIDVITRSFFTNSSLRLRIMCAAYGFLIVRLPVSDILIAMTASIGLYYLISKPTRLDRSADRLRTPSNTIGHVGLGVRGLNG